MYRDTLKAESLAVPGINSKLEALWMRFVGATIFVVGVFYPPPKSLIDPALDDLQFQMTSILARQHPLYALGDVNTRTAGGGGCFQPPPLWFFRCNSKTSEATTLKLCIAVHQTILHHL